jgi:hypothetical protein
VRWERTVYVVWGSAYLAIKYAVAGVRLRQPPRSPSPLGALFLAEPLRPSVVVGGAVIIAAVPLVMTAESRARRRPAPGPDEDATPLEPA